MYKCKECGTEFEVKPDYCDCGNDTFEQIITTPATNSNAVSGETQVDSEEPKTTVEISAKSQEKEYKAATEINTKELLSWAIFAICIILSILSIMFLGNSKTEEISNAKSETTKTENAIPALETLWDNSLPTVQNEEVKKNSKIEVENQPTQPQKDKTSAITLPVQKSQTNNITKLSTTNKTVNTTNTTTKQNTTSQIKSQPQKPIQTVSANSNSSNSSQLKAELEHYKISLRNYIASKINFAGVIGDGTCSVSFKLDSNGNLVNRTFTQQSESVSLNDSVYKAVLSTPSYNPPPAGYKNETLKLTVKMYNGNFEVSLH